MLLALQICAFGLGHLSLEDAEMVNVTEFRNGMCLLTGAVNVITTSGRNRALWLYRFGSVQCDRQSTDFIGVHESLVQLALPF